MLTVKLNYLQSLDVRFCSLLGAMDELLGLHLIGYWVDPLSASVSFLHGVIVGALIAVSFSPLVVRLLLEAK